MRKSLTAFAIAAVLLAAPVPAEAGVGPVAGADGAGDSYYPDYGNGGYDVDNYNVKLKYQPEGDQLSGTTKITAKATKQLSSFNLDFALDVSSVTVNGKAASFSRSGAHELVIVPASPLRNHAAMVVEVTYSGTPSTVKIDGYSAWKHTSDGALAIGEPEVAWWWYPSNDHPTDKATHDISVTVPDGVEAISNGTLTRPATSTDGWTSWDWHSAKPMATYLAFLAIGQYDVEYSTAPNGQPVIFAYSQNAGAVSANARAAISRTPEVTAWAEKLFGPYPFEAQGGVLLPANTIGYALETQTRPVYSTKFWQRGPGVYVVVHELAHQWFGDSVSVKDWRDIWLNEGFAAYTEWLWSESHGEGTAQEIFNSEYAARAATDPFWQVMPGDPGADNPFAAAVYDRGAMAVHQLRLAVGDRKFFNILRGWQKHKKYCAATITEFREYAERLSGKDLAPLFTQWLYTKGRPELGAPATNTPLGGVGAPATNTPLGGVGAPATNTPLGGVGAPSSDGVGAPGANRVGVLER